MPFEMILKLRKNYHSIKISGIQFLFWNDFLCLYFEMILKLKKIIIQEKSLVTLDGFVRFELKSVYVQRLY